MFACLHVPDFFVQAALRSEPESRRQLLKQGAVAILDGPASLLRVIATNPKGRLAGIAIDMTKLQAESCGPVFTRKRTVQNGDCAQAALLDYARGFSPCVESTAPGTVILDLGGTEKLLGDSQLAISRMAQQSCKLGFDLNVAAASNPDTALYAAWGWSGITVIAPGEEAQRLARLPVHVLSSSPEILETLESWGIRTLGSLAALPPIPLIERLGQEGLQLQKLARGEALRNLVLAEPAQDFIESFEFEDPVETLESLTFVLHRLLQQLCLRLTSRCLATNELRLTLELETWNRHGTAAQEVFQRAWKLPLPMVDTKVLVRLTALDLSASSFSAPIKKLIVQAVPAKPRFSQTGLFVPASPQAEQLEITLARIRSLVGSADENGIVCVGSPEVVDSHKPGSFIVQSFSPERVVSAAQDPARPVLVLRRFRPAPEISVELNNERPCSVRWGKKVLRVLAASGPWPVSGQWWELSSAWAKDEWEIAMKTSDGVGFYRIYLDRIRKHWFVEGMFD